jgi:branched-chain amino acid transport system permease protein
VEQIIQFVLSGLSQGGVYALIAIGFYMMWSATHAANFTHGDIFMLGAVSTVVLGEVGIPLLLAMPLGIAISAVAGALIERIAVRPFNHGPNSIGWMLTTIALGLMLESALTATYGPLGQPLYSPLAQSPIRIGGSGIYPQELLIPAVAIVLMFLLDVFYRHTLLGRAMLAVAANPTAAGLMGINVNRIALIAYAMAGAIGALGGILVAPISEASSSMGTLVGLKAFVIAIVAGISNARGVVVVALGYGILEKFIEGYISTAARNSIGFAILILLLLAFPNGIFGKREVSKV